MGRLTRNDRQVPDGWRVARLGDVAEVRGGVGFPLDRQGRKSGDYPFIKVSDMTLAGNETYIRAANNYVLERDVIELGAKPFAPGTVVFPKVGAAIATNKKRALTAPTIIDNNMVGITASNSGTSDARFLHNWFEFVDISQFANVSTVPSITGSRLKRESILLPPLSEQRAIAAVLDSIDEAIERTEAVIAATERLRDALLHELLTRGVPGWHNEWKDAPGIGTIPADWEVVRLGDVIPKFEYGTSVRCHEKPLGIPVLRIPNIAKGELDLADVKYANVSDSELAKLQLAKGDILLVRTNGNPDICGKCWVTEDLEGQWAFASYLVRGRPDQSRTDPAFIGHFLSSHTGRGSLRAHIRTSAGNYNLSVRDLTSIRIPQPCRREQTAIVDAITKTIRYRDAFRRVLSELRSAGAATADALLTGAVRVAGRN